MAGSCRRPWPGAGHDCRRHHCRCIAASASASIRSNRPISSLHIPFGDRIVGGRLWRLHAARLTVVPVYLVEQPDYFERDDPAQGRGLYQFTCRPAHVRDYPDNCERFIFFCRAVLEALRLLDFWPDVLHVNDWQTGLVPVYLREDYRNHPTPALRAQLPGRSARCSRSTTSPIRGCSGTDHDPLTGLDWRLFNHPQLEFYGHLNFLKAGIVFADLLTTVSPTYAREIQTPYFGCGLQGVLARAAATACSASSTASITTSGTRPTDPHLPAHYDADAIEPGKPRARRPCSSVTVWPRSRGRRCWAWWPGWSSRRARPDRAGGARCS